MRLIDRIGHRYSRLTVVERAPNKSATDTNARWVCRCDCGNTCIAYGQDLARGKFKSCGCLNAEQRGRWTHGYAKTPVYWTWAGIIQRCTNPNNPKFKNYGGRGITVCEEWKSFERFLADMGHRPKGFTIDRIDNDKGYFKENCRWATAVEQANNKRNNRRVTIDGQTRTVSEWAAMIGIGWPQVQQRLAKGWSIEDAVTVPFGKSRTSRKE